MAIRKVVNYLSSVFSKLGMTSRAEIGAFGLMMGTFAIEDRHEAESEPTRNPSAEN